MTTGFNPNNPDAVGLEWFPTVERRPIVTQQQVATTQFIATVTEDIDRAYVQVNRSAGQEAPGANVKSAYVLEIYQRGNIPFGTPTEGTHAPGEDAQNVDAFKSST